MLTEKGKLNIVILFNFFNQIKIARSPAVQ